MGGGIMDDVLKEMRRRLTERRKQLRLTKEEVAERAELTPQTISTVETGRKVLRPENIIKVCVALGISPDYLLLGNTTGVDISIQHPIKIAVPYEKGKVFQYLSTQSNSKSTTLKTGR